MNYNSPITEYIMEPFDLYLDSKNNLNCDNMALFQLSFLLLTISFYYFYKNMNDRSGLLYLGAYIFFYKYIKNINNDDIKFISEISYFLINCLLIIFIINDRKYNDNFLIFMTLVILLTFLSFILKLDTNVEYQNSNLNGLNKIFKRTCNNLYPNDNLTKKYHIHKFWKIFDLSTFSFIIFLFLSNSNI